MNCLFLLIAVACQGALGLRQGTRVPEIAPGAQTLETCALNGGPEDGEIDDSVLLSDWTQNDTKPTKAEQKEMKEALKNFLKVKQEMMTAQNRLLTAMELILEVPPVSGAELQGKVKEGKKDLLVVFYAAWCGHCQRFVLHDGKGNPEEAPLEKFNRYIKKQGADQTLSILRFDVQKYKDQIPSDFEVMGIPTVYLVAAGGSKTKFQGNPNDFQALLKFIETHSEKTKKIASEKSGNMIKV